MKRLFQSQQNFIDELYNLEPEGSLTDHFGIRFRGLNEITHNDDDDGDFAGPQFYVVESQMMFDENFPKEFPCVVRIMYDHVSYVISMCVYQSDFK